MDEVSRNAEDPVVSQIIYPLMQTADIGYLNIDIAVGGIDQRKIHMLAREELHSMGFKSPVCVHTPILLGLDANKMSSSRNNLIAPVVPVLRLSPIQARRARATPKVRRLDLLRGLLHARAGLRRRQASPAGSQKRCSDVCRRNHRAYS
jgi:hypothetical protein